MMIHHSGKSAHLAQKSYFYEETINKQSLTLSKVTFWPKQNIQISAYTKLLNLELSGNDLLYIVIKAWRNALKL